MSSDIPRSGDQPVAREENLMNRSTTSSSVVGRSAAGFLLSALVALVAACSGSSTGTGGASSPVVVNPGGSDDGNGGFAKSAKLEATLPKSANGVALTTGSINVLQLYTTGNTAANFLTVFSTDLGVPPAQIGAAAAADVTGGTIQIVAGQFAGQTSAALQTEIEKMARQSDSKVTLANTTIGGKQVTTATYPTSQAGPIISYITGDTIYLIQSPVPATAEDALKQLP
jgi:hypothetical protein